MPIQFATPSEESLKVLQQALSKKMQETGTRGLSNGTNSVLASSDSLYPHAVYSLTLQDLAGDDGLKAARLVAWRYLIKDSPSGQAAEVNQLPTGPAFASLSAGSPEEPTPALFQQLSDDGAVKAGDFEPRLLRVPSLHTSALWLYDRSGNGGDLFLPVRRIANFLKNVQYSKSEFENALRKASKEELARKGNAKG